MSAQDLFTKYFQNAPAPGIIPGDRVRRKTIEALEAVDRDVQQQGAITYETVELVRAVLALVRSF